MMGNWLTAPTPFMSSRNTKMGSHEKIVTPHSCVCYVNLLF